MPFHELPPDDETVLSASARMTACSVAVTLRLAAVTSPFTTCASTSLRYVVEHDEPAEADRGRLGEVEALRHEIRDRERLPPAEVAVGVLGSVQVDRRSARAHPLVDRPRAAADREPQRRVAVVLRVDVELAVGAEVLVERAGLAAERRPQVRVAEVLLPRGRAAGSGRGSGRRRRCRRRPRSPPRRGRCRRARAAGSPTRSSGGRSRSSPSSSTMSPVTRSTFCTIGKVAGRRGRPSRSRARAARGRRRRASARPRSSGSPPGRSC